MNLLKITVIFIALIGVKPLYASVMSFDFTYEYISGENLSGSFVGDLQADNNTILAINDFSALYSGAPVIQLSELSSKVATISGGVPFALTSVSPRTGFAGFDLTASGRAIIEDGDIAGLQYENELFSGDRWRVTVNPVDVSEPHGILLMLFGMVALYQIRKRKTN